ncbi:MAG: DUF1028 domain-containing protein [Bacteroidota bacterium]
MMLHLAGARRRVAPLALALAAALAAFAAGPASVDARVVTGTFSIVACDTVTQELGVAVQSKYFSVGTTVPWAEAGVGAVATQANVNPSLGPQALALLRSGMSAPEVVRALAAADSGWDGRQFGIVDASGRSATWTGKRCMDWAGGETGPAFSCQGNILAGPAVVQGMARAFRETKGELAERMIAALEAAQAAGGDKRGQQSAAIIVVRPSPDHPELRERYIDLRVEDSKTPIKELRRVWQIDQGFHLANAHLLYAAQFEKEGKPELARMERDRVGETLQRALARGERDASILNGLAWACASNGIFLEDAVKAAQRAVDVEPRNVDILDTLAEAHFRLGHRDKAIEVETQAARIDSKSQYLKDQIVRFKGDEK